MNKLKACWAVLVIMLIIIGVIVIDVIIDVPKTPRLALSEKNIRCRDYITTDAIDISQPLQIAVWNIYKQQLDDWDSELLAMSQTSSLILLQEAQSSPELINYIAENGWHSNQAFAFSVNGEIAGVMTLSDLTPNNVCAYSKIEPYLRLPKSALYSTFPLSNGETLSVINIHSINFTFGIEEYREQLQVLIDAANKIKGPLIIAGDFNTWSERRLQVVQAELKEIGLQEVILSSDVRLRVFGLPLDHIFYRGLKLEKASTKETKASDHNMIFASFLFENT